MYPDFSNEKAFFACGSSFALSSLKYLISESFIGFVNSSVADFLGKDRFVFLEGEQLKK